MKPFNDLLEEMKSRGDHLTLVVDEYGSVSGLITIEDLVEEIVGEINDDTEAATEELVEEGSGTYLIPAGTELDLIAERLGRPLFQTTECTTLGGAVVELFGRLPAIGERIRHEDLSLEVVDADRRQVKSVRLRIAAPQSDTRMMRSARSALDHVDLALLIADASTPIGEGTGSCSRVVRKLPSRRFLLLNKIDRMRKPDLLPLIADYQDEPLDAIDLHRCRGYPGGLQATE